MSGEKTDYQEESLLPAKLQNPEIEVIEGGKKVVRPDVIQAVTQLASLAQLTRIRESLEREHFQGKIDPRVLDASEERKLLNLVDEEPWTPWASVFVINYGPDKVKIAINKPWNFEEVKLNETRTIDNTKADKRIERIYYQCNPGETALLTLKGQY